MADLQKYESTFCQQTISIMVGLRKNLEVLDKNPQDKSALQECLLYFHTLKGSAAVMGCKGLESFAKMAEENVKRAKDISNLKSSCQEIEKIAGDFKKLKNY